MDKIHFGKYVAVEEIGRGGMSIVYKGNHPTLSKPIAIKVLSDFLSSDTKFIDRFQKEADLLSSFRHANIVSVLDYGKQGSTYYIVMDYIEGFTVQQMITETGPLSLDIITNILQSVATALAYTHRKSIVHQDIKSSNIMIDNNGHIMVTDFGLFRNVSLDNPDQITAEIVGTLSYCAPEQLDHKMGQINATTDIYSLGVVFYQMATGQLPFADENTSVNIAYQHINVLPESPKKLKPDLLLKASSMIMKMLKKKQSDRYQNMEEILKDIQELQEVSQYYRSKYQGEEEGSFFVIQSDSDDSKMGRENADNISQEIVLEYQSSDTEESKPIEEEIRYDSDIDTIDTESEPIDIEEDGEEGVEMGQQEDIEHSFDSDAYIGKEIKHRYRVQKLLLRRILSKLYYGVDLVKDIPVTIQLPNEARPTFQTRINREIQTMKKIDHPGFVRFLDVVEEDGTYFVIREYVEGSSVKNLLKREQFSIKRSVSIALEVLDALAYLHQRKIIHRDLNSDVVMVPKKGRTRISSLGFTRVEDASSVSSGEFLGVVQYTAPEQITQSFSDARTDIYAVGILLFEMLTGSPPFDSTLPVEVMDMHLKKIPRFPEESQKGIPLTLQRIVLRALAKQPEQRFQTAEEMQEALETFLRDFTGKQSNHPLSSHQKSEQPNSKPKQITQTSKKGFSVSSDTGLYRDLQKKNTTRKPVSFSIKNKPSMKIDQDSKVDIRRIINDDLKMDSRTKEIEGNPSFSEEMNSQEQEVYAETQKSTHPKADFAGSHSPTFSMKNTKHDSNEKKPSSKKRLWFPIILTFAVVGLLFFLIYPFAKPQTVKQPQTVVDSDYLEWISPKSVNDVFLSPLIPTTITFQNNSWQMGNSYAIKNITPSVESKISSVSNEGVFSLTLFSSNPDLEKLIQFKLQYLDSSGNIINEATYTIANSPESVSEISINYHKATYSLNGEKPQSNEPNIFIYQEKIYIPIRFLIRVFNAELAYDFEEEKITIQSLDQHVYEFYLFQKKYSIDNQLITGVNPILEINDTAYLPIDFLSLKMRFSVILERNLEGHFMIHLIKNTET